MNLNIKQKELVDFLFNKVKEKFPDIEFYNLTTSPDDREHIWINVIIEKEKDSSKISRYSSEFSVDILIDYGYQISVMPCNRKWAENYLSRAC